MDSNPDSETWRASCNKPPKDAAVWRNSLYIFIETFFWSKNHSEDRADSHTVVRIG